MKINFLNNFNKIKSISIKNHMITNTLQKSFNNKINNKFNKNKDKENFTFFKKKYFCELEQIRDKFAEDRITSMTKKKFDVPEKYLFTPNNLKSYLMEEEIPFIYRMQKNIEEYFGSRKEHFSIDLEIGEYFIMKNIIAFLAHQSISLNIENKLKIMNVIICVKKNYLFIYFIPYLFLIYSLFIINFFQ
jgi:hypothetical protein